MPEGDTLFRIARTLRPIMREQTIQAARRGRDWFRIDADSFVGRVVTEVEARGKHLLIHLDDGRAIHSHLGMTGSWHVYHPGQPWLKPERRAALVFELAEWTIVCFSPKSLETLSPMGLRQQSYLRNLGPDLLSPDFDEEAALARYRFHGELPIGEAVMDQTLACGIGNEYKSEILFLERLDPFRPVEQMSDEQVLSLLRRARWLMRRNLRGGPRQTRFGHGKARVWVYGRAGEECYECGTAIQMRRQGDLGRSTYWCPACQSPSCPPEGKRR